MREPTIIDRMARQIEQIYTQTGELPAQLRISKAQADELHVAAGLPIPDNYVATSLMFWNVPLIVDNDFFEAANGATAH